MSEQPKMILLVEDSSDDADVRRRALRSGSVANGIVQVRDGAEEVIRREQAELRFRSFRIAGSEPGESE